eukprot:403348782
MQQQQQDNSRRKRECGFCKFTKRSLRSIDQFGHPIQLNYKGEEAFKSSIGGIFTIISLFLVIGYFSLLIKALTENDSDIKAIIGYKDYFKQSFEVNVNDTFDFAVRISGDGSEVLQRYVSLLMFTSTFVSKFNDKNEFVKAEILGETSFMVPCEKDRLFKNQRFQEEQQIYGDYSSDWWCPDNNLKYKIQQGKHEVFVWIEKCDQGELDYYQGPGQYKCETNSTKITRFLNSVEVYVYTASKYFDLTEFDNFPIKDVVDKKEFSFSTTQTRVIEYGLSVNEATGTSSRLSDSLGKFNHTYVQSEFLREYNVQQIQQYMKIQFDIQNQYSNIERKNKHFVGVLSETGGILGIVVGFFVVFSGPIQEMLFYSSIIAQVFLSEMQTKAKGKNGKQKQRSGGQNQDSKNNQTSSSDIQNEKFVKQDTFAKTRPQDFQSYVQMIRIIMSRQNFKYTIGEAWKNLYGSICCCRKATMKKRMYEIGKEKVEKELDISSIIKQMRVLKLVSKIYLNKYQRKLVPFFKSNMLSSKLEKQIKKEKTQEFNELESKQTKQERGVEISDNLIQLFTDCKCQSQKSMKIIDSIIGLKEDEVQDQEDMTLKQKLFRGLMREYAVKHIINGEEDSQSGVNCLDQPPVQNKKILENERYAAPQEQQVEGPIMNTQRMDDDEESLCEIGIEKASNQDLEDHQKKTNYFQKSHMYQ